MSFIPWHTTCPLSYDTLHIPYPMIHYLSLIQWYPIYLLSHDTVDSPYPMTHYMSFIPDTLHISYPWHITHILSLTQYMSLIQWHQMYLIPWNTTYPRSLDTLHVHYFMKHYMSIIWWQTTCAYSMICSMSLSHNKLMPLIPWHTTYSLLHNTIHPPYHITHYMPLIFWQSTQRYPLLYIHGLQITG